ncbi:MAG TPA: patatin-like phospholipase family protein [Clostridia bacterium]|nr:patatin-like phospholipase family protein [Clostridia bacterium]
METRKEQRLGLALSSGGVLGYAHIGVLRALEELHVQVDLLSGASMGAIVAVFNAAGLDAAGLEALSVKYSAQVAMLFGAIVPVNRLTTPSRLRASLRKDLPVTVFEALQKPVCIAATDVLTGNALVFDSGDIWSPLSGSFGLPGVFPVVKVGDQYVLDGCFSLPVPVTELRKRGATSVIAVSVYDVAQHEDFKPSWNIPKVLELSVNLTFAKIARPELDAADLVIRPDLKGCEPSDVHEYALRGYEATMARQAEIEALLA